MVTIAAASCLRGNRHRRQPGELSRKERKRHKKTSGMRGIFASPFLRPFAFLSAEVILGPMGSCSFCAFCHNNEMSNLGHTEVIPSPTPDMAWPGFRPRRGCVEKIRAKRSQLGKVSGEDAQPIRCRSGRALRRVDCAKQSQTREDWGMWARAVIMWGGFAGKWNGRNEPNSAKPAGRPGPWRGRMCKTNPISPRGPTGAEANCAKRTQFPAVPEGARPQGRGTRGECAKRSQFGAVRLASGGELCKTKNKARLGQDGTSGRRSAREGANGAKRTQFARRCRVGRGLGGVGRGELCETNPIWPGLGGTRSPLGERCKTNPISGVGRRVEYPSFHYSIIPPFQSGANRAKQSQFARGRAFQRSCLTIDIDSGT